jgi:RCC1 and BTB domain-containing protein
MNIPTKLPGNKTYISFALGSYHSLVLTDQGIVYAFGYNNVRIFIFILKKFGQLGDGTIINQPIPIKVSGGNNFDVKNVFAGDSHSIMLKKNGQILSWGLNNVIFATIFNLLVFPTW